MTLFSRFFHKNPDLHPASIFSKSVIFRGFYKNSQGQANWLIEEYLLDYLVSMPIILVCILSLQALSEDIFLSQGASKSLPLHTEAPVYTGNKKILFFHKEGARLVITGKLQGRTFLKTPSKFYRVFVVSRSMLANIQRVRKLLQGFWGLYLDVEQDKILIKGRVYRIEDWISLAKLAKKYQIPYEFKAKPSQGLPDQINAYLAARLAPLEIPRIKWRSLPLALIPKNASESSYSDLLQPLGLIPKKEATWLQASSFIKIQILLVETSKQQAHSLGLNLESLSKFLNFLTQKARGRVLHQSSFLAQDGVPLHVHSGGQIPIAKHNLISKTPSIQWKGYGLNLDILAHHVSNSGIQIKISASLSEPSPQLTLAASPSLKTKTFKTNIQVKPRQLVRVFQIKKQGSGWGAKHASMPLAGTDSYEVSQELFLQAWTWQKK